MDGPTVLRAGPRWTHAPPSRRQRQTGRVISKTPSAAAAAPRQPPVQPRSRVAQRARSLRPGLRKGASLCPGRHAMMNLMQEGRENMLRTPDGWRLAGMGFLTLFLELALIRYLPGNIWNLGYFPNLILIAVFIGMGLGFMFHHLVEARG